MSGASLQTATVLAAFWLALALHQRRDPARTPRFAASLLVGAVAAHLGWVLCFSPEIGRRALDVAGVSVLFLPLGPLLLARRGTSFACLPLPIALSRLGCLAGGCCQGQTGALLPLLDAGGLALLHGVCRRLPDARIERAFLLGFAAIRLLELPWRTSEVSASIVTASLAAGWLGLAWARPGRGRMTNS